MRVILDTNIVISGLLWGGMPRKLLDLGMDDKISLFTSSLLLDELASVLKRDKFTTILASQNISPTFLMQRYGLLAKLVITQNIKRIVRDIDDDLVIATAVAAQANLIVSGDNDLLALHPYQKISILNATDAVNHIKTKEQKD